MGSMYLSNKNILMDKCKPSLDGLKFTISVSLRALTCYNIKPLIENTWEFKKLGVILLETRDDIVVRTHKV